MILVFAFKGRLSVHQTVTCGMKSVKKPFIFSCFISSHWCQTGKTSICQHHRAPPSNNVPYQLMQHGAELQHLQRKQSERRLSYPTCNLPQTDWFPSRVDRPAAICVSPAARGEIPITVDSYIYLFIVFASACTCQCSKSLHCVCVCACVQVIDRPLCCYWSQHASFAACDRTPAGLCVTPVITD